MAALISKTLLAGPKPQSIGPCADLKGRKLPKAPFIACSSSSVCGLTVPAALNPLPMLFCREVPLPEDWKAMEEIARMSEKGDDAAAIEELLQLLIDILSSATRLPRGPESDVALLQIGELQKSVGVVLLKRFYDKA
ncbi:hypothetical protein [Bradyrhizobium icense]|nr:hypothetical protein [Bradyrhizobium icense]